MEPSTNMRCRLNDLARPQSGQLVELHVYLVPEERWVAKRKLAKNQVVDYAISTGFIRVLPTQRLAELRYEIDTQLGNEVVPRTYVFLRSVGRNFTQVKARQEMELKVKNYIPPYASEPEIYLKAGDFREPYWSQGDDSGVEESLQDYRNGIPVTEKKLPTLSPVSSPESFSDVSLGKKFHLSRPSKVRRNSVLARGCTHWHRDSTDAAPSAPSAEEAEEPHYANTVLPSEFPLHRSHDEQPDSSEQITNADDQNQKQEIHDRVGSPLKPITQSERIPPPGTEEEETPQHNGDHTNHLPHKQRPRQEDEELESKIDKTEKLCTHHEAHQQQQLQGGESGTTEKSHKVVNFIPNAADDKTSAQVGTEINAEHEKKSQKRSKPQPSFTARSKYSETLDPGSTTGRQSNVVSGPTTTTSNKSTLSKKTILNRPVGVRVRPKIARKPSKEHPVIIEKARVELTPGTEKILDNEDEDVGEIVAFIRGKGSGMDVEDAPRPPQTDSHRSRHGLVVKKQDRHRHASSSSTSPVVVDKAKLVADSYRSSKGKNIASKPSFKIEVSVRELGNFSTQTDSVEGNVIASSTRTAVSTGKQPLSSLHRQLTLPFTPDRAQTVAMTSGNAMASKSSNKKADSSVKVGVNMSEMNNNNDGGPKKSGIFEAQNVEVREMLVDRREEEAVSLAPDVSETSSISKEIQNCFSEEALSVDRENDVPNEQEVDDGRKAEDDSVLEKRPPNPDGGTAVQQQHQVVSEISGEVDSETKVQGENNQEIANNVDDDYKDDEAEVVKSTEAPEAENSNNSDEPQMSEAHKDTEIDQKVEKEDDDDDAAETAAQDGLNRSDLEGNIDENQLTDEPVARSPKVGSFDSSQEECTVKEIVTEATVHLQPSESTDNIADVATDTVVDSLAQEAESENNPEEGNQENELEIIEGSGDKAEESTLPTAGETENEETTAKAANENEEASQSLEIQEPSDAPGDVNTDANEEQSTEDDGTTNPDTEQNADPDASANNTPEQQTDDVNEDETETRQNVTNEEKELKRNLSTEMSETSAVESERDVGDDSENEKVEKDAIENEIKTAVVNIMSDELGKGIETADAPQVAEINDEGYETQTDKLEENQLEKGAATEETSESKDSEVEHKDADIENDSSEGLDDSDETAAEQEPSDNSPEENTESRAEELPKSMKENEPENYISESAEQSGESAPENESAKDAEAEKVEVAEENNSAEAEEDQGKNVSEEDAEERNENADLEEASESTQNDAGEANSDAEEKDLEYNSKNIPLEQSESEQMYGDKTEKTEESENQTDNEAEQTEEDAKLLEEENDEEKDKNKDEVSRNLLQEDNNEDNEEQQTQDSSTEAEAEATEETVKDHEEFDQRAETAGECDNSVVQNEEKDHDEENEDENLGTEEQNVAESADNDAENNTQQGLESKQDDPSSPTPDEIEGEEPIAREDQDSGQNEWPETETKSDNEESEDDKNPEGEPVVDTAKSASVIVEHNVDEIAASDNQKSDETGDREGTEATENASATELEAQAWEEEEKEANNETSNELLSQHDEENQISSDGMTDELNKPDDATETPIAPATLESQADETSTAKKSSDDKRRKKIPEILPSKPSFPTKRTGVFHVNKKTTGLQNKTRSESSLPPESCSFSSIQGNTTPKKDARAMNYVKYRRHYTTPPEGPVGNLRRSRSHSFGLPDVGLKKSSEGKRRTASTNFEDQGFIEIENLEQKLSTLRAERRVCQTRREELLRKAKHLQNKTNSKRDQARDMWRRRYLDEKKVSPQLEDECARSRAEIEKLHRDLLAKVEVDFRSAVMAGVKTEQPSNKLSYKIMIAKILQEIEDLKRRLESTKIRLAAEVRLRTNAEKEVKILREDLLKKKIQVTLTRKETKNVISPLYRDSFYFVGPV